MYDSQQCWRRARRLLGTGMALFLAACGSSAGGPTLIDPSSVTFEYGPGSDVSGTPLAGFVVERVVNAREEVVYPGDASTEHRRVLDLASLPIDLAKVFGPWRQFVEDQIPWATCVAATPELVRYQGCHVVLQDYGQTVTIDLEGLLTRSGTTLTWDLSLRDNAETYHLVGKLTASAGNVAGLVRADGIDLGISVTYAAVLGLDLDGAGCPYAGAVESKRLYPESEKLYEQDGGALLTWTGCGVATLATSVPP